VFVAKRRGVGGLGDCETNPEDPICQEYYGGNPPSDESTIASSIWDAVSGAIEGAQKLVGSISQIPTSPMPPPIPAPVPFYKTTPFLLGVLGVAAFGTYKFATRRKTRS